MQYFHMSRQTGFKTGVRDWHPARTWFYVSGKRRTTARQVFATAGLDAETYRDTLRRYGIPDIDMALPDALKANVVKALNTLFMDVLRQNVDARISLAPFYENALAGKSRIALVDIGWVGNIQRCFLHSLREPTATLRVFGYYLGLHRDHRFALQIGGPGDGWEAREAGKHRDEAAAG